MSDGDLMRLASRRGEIVAKAQVTHTGRGRPGLRHLPLPRIGGQLPDQPGVDPQAKIPEFKVCAVKLEKYSS